MYFLTHTQSVSFLINICTDTLSRNAHCQTFQSKNKNGRGWPRGWSLLSEGPEAHSAGAVHILHDMAPTVLQVQWIHPLGEAMPVLLIDEDGGHTLSVLHTTHAQLQDSIIWAGERWEREEKEGLSDYFCCVFAQPAHVQGIRQPTGHVIPQTPLTSQTASYTCWHLLSK